jgi:hypothetical protein
MGSTPNDRRPRISTCEHFGGALFGFHTRHYANCFAALTRRIFKIAQPRFKLAPEPIFQKFKMGSPGTKKLELKFKTASGRNADAGVIFLV